MGTCVCKVALKAIRHSGAFIGDDWVYKISVNEEPHSINGNGDNMQFHPAREWKVAGGSCGIPMQLVIAVRAIEEDLMFDDEGTDRARIRISCPGEDASEPLIQMEKTLTAHVTEDRGVSTGGTNQVAFDFEIEAWCDTGDAAAE